MDPNPILRRLGFSNTDRVVIFHADDIGSCHSSLASYADLVEFGLLSSASTMVPCPWFPATAAFCRAHRQMPSLDMGVHLTLTSEWNGYRWGPLSTRDAASGLIDAEGYFYRDEMGVQAHATSEAVAAELTAQVEEALAAGIDVTHIDSHMMSLFHPRLLPLYLGLTRAYALPFFMLRPGSEAIRRWSFAEDVAELVGGPLAEAEQIGFPLFDDVHVMSLTEPEDRLVQAKAVLASIPPGLTYFLVHPAHDTPEVRAMAPDWRCRIADHALFTDEAWRAAVRDAGVQVIGFRVLRDVLRRAI